jgi:anti-sigma B factor antagonist
LYSELEENTLAFDDIWVHDAVMPDPSVNTGTSSSKSLGAADIDLTVGVADESNAKAIDVICVGGEVDIATAPRLYEKIMAAFGDEPGELIIDLSDVKFIDSTGLGVLVNARQRARSVGAALKLRLPDGQARYPFEVTGLVSVFDLDDGGAVAKSAS